MGFYDEEETAKQYIEMAEGSDGRALIAVMSDYLSQGASVLELGMGPGVDLDILLERYQATGSDTSTFFIDRYRQLHPGADLLELDAVSVATDRTFDCIYSNKVLHHLNDNELRTSLQHQHKRLNRGGHVMHSFWRGDRFEEIEGMKFFYRTEAQVRSLFDPLYEVVKLNVYAELEDGDSLYILARKGDADELDP